MIYLDHAATTPVLPYAFTVMKPWLNGSMIGNPSSLHSAGKQARDAVETAREKVAQLINASPDEIFFTSGGTESNNMVLQGAAVARRNGVFISSGIEHHAILNQKDLLHRKYGVELVCAATRRDGVICIEDLVDLIQKKTPYLVSVMLANNETGVVQPIKEIAKLCYKFGAIFHTDAVQAIGHMDVDVKALGVDMLSLSGHKFGAPDGVGVLYIRKNAQSWLEPIMYGGSQERNMRAGTENVAAIVGLGAAAGWTIEHIESEICWYQYLKDMFMMTLNTEFGEEVRTNGCGNVLPNIISITIPGVQSESLLLMMDADDVCISAASACSAGSPKPSHVLTAMGITKDEANCTVRISLGRANKRDEVVDAAKLLAKNVKRIRNMYH